MKPSFFKKLSLIFISHLILIADPASAIDFIGAPDLPDEHSNVRMTCKPDDQKKYNRCYVIFKENDKSNSNSLLLPFEKIPWEDVVAESRNFGRSRIPFDQIYKLNIAPEILKSIRRFTSRYPDSVKQDIAQIMLYTDETCSFWRGVEQGREASLYMCGKLPDSSGYSSTDNKIVIVLMIWPGAVLLLNRVR